MTGNVNYVGRPGPSPVLAAFYAAGIIRDDDRVLDLGCGTGLDAVALARWGCGAVTGLDVDRKALGVARGRARKARVLDRVRFVEGDARAMEGLFPRGAFDVVWDGLLLNNLREGEAEEAHARSLGHVTRRDGLLVLQFRVTKAGYDSWATEAANDALSRWFDFGPPAITLIPEHPGREGAPPYARVVVQVGRRNRLRTKPRTRG